MSKKTKSIIERTPFLALSALIFLGGVFLSVPSASAAIAQVSRNLDSTVKINSATGYPLWYEDISGGGGSRLQLCLGTNPDGTGPADPLCVLPGFATIPDITVNPVGFPDESFYWIAEASLNIDDGDPVTPVSPGVFRMALEGAFASATSTSGQQIVFARVNLRMNQQNAFAKSADPLATNTYTVQYPFGQFTFTTNNLGEIIAASAPFFQVGGGGGAGKQVRTEDPAIIIPLDFVALLPAANTQINRFLKWDPAVLPLAPVGYIGDGITPHTVTGGSVRNSFIISGPGVGGVGVNTLTETQFTVAGKLALNNPPVISAIPAQAVAVGSTTSFTAVASDADADPITFSIVSRSAVGNEAAAAINPTTGAFSWTPNTVGTSTFIIGASDGVATATTTATIIVSSSTPPGADVTPPIITILGANPASVSVGAVYSDAGVTATDNVDGNITANIITTGLPINTSATGTFAVVYSVSDAAGNSASSTRVVNVTANPPAATSTLTTITVSPASATIGVQLGQQLTATAKDQNGAVISVPIAWASSNSLIASVDGSGFVTGISVGSAIITASSGNASGAAAISVAVGAGGGGGSSGGGGGGGGSSFAVARFDDNPSARDIAEGRVLGAATSREALQAQVLVLQKQLIALLQQLLQQLLASRQPGAVAGANTQVKTYNVVGGTPSLFRFSVDEIEVNQGDRVRINFSVSQGAHNFILDEFNVKTSVIQAPDKKVETVEFTADKKGIYEYYCSVGSHRAMGMVGKFKVE